MLIGIDDRGLGLGGVKEGVEEKFKMATLIAVVTKNN